MARNHEKMLSINGYRKIKIKTTTDCGYILSRIAKIKLLKIARLSEAVEQPEPSYTNNGCAHLYKHFQELFGNFF